MEQLFPNPRVRKNRGKKDCRPKNPPQRLRLETLEERTLLSSDPIAGAGFSPPPPALVETVEPLQPLSITGSTMDKPQSKLWFHDNNWWSVLAGTGGTYLWRLDGSTWTQALKLTTSKYRADAKVVGDVTHVLLYGGQTTRLASLEYVPGSDGSPGTYKFWSQRPKSAPISLSSGVQTATIDVDCTGRMWLASDGTNTIEARYSDAPYSTWSQPIVLASDVGTQDISVVTALPTCQVGVLWSNQSTKRFGFRVHTDGVDAATWAADEVPASQSAQNDGTGMAKEHLNVAVASDGTLYAAVKTGFKSPTLPQIGLLVRRPSGTWDAMADVDHAGTRPIVVLNEDLGHVFVAYTASDLPSDIVYRDSEISTISFGGRKTLIAGAFNDVTSTKQNWSDSVVFLASGGGSVVGATLTAQVDTDITPPVDDTPPQVENRSPQVDAGADQTRFVTESASLDGTVQDDGLPNPPGDITVHWTQVSGPGTVGFDDDTALDTTVTFSTVGTYVLWLEADDGELIAGDELTITVTPPTNGAPQVDAGADQTVFVTEAVTLDGVVQDDDLPDPPASIATMWSKVSGPGTVTFENDTATQTTAVFSAEGNYVLRLQADDGELAAGDELTITVTPPPNEAPLVDAGADQTVFITEAVALDGAVQDDDLPVPPASIATMWSRVSGPGTVTFEDDSATQTTAIFSAVGTYVLRLQADDGELTTSDELTITVTPPPNQAPLVDAGTDQTVIATESVELGGAVQDDDLPNPPGSISTTWTKVSGPGTVTFGDDSATQTTAIFSAVGTYVLRLQADDGELTTSDELTITVTPPPNQAPEADAGADLITIVSKTTNLSGTVRDDGLPDLPGKLTTGWTKVSGPGTVTFRDAAAAQTTAIFNAAGTYVLRLQTGDGALTASDDVTITVTGPGGNRRPEVNAGPDQTVVVLKPLNLRGVIRDDGLPKLPGKLTGAWTKVSGPGTVKFAKASAASTAAIFSAPGAYVLRLQANDGALTASDEVAITVLPPLPNQAPVVNAGVDQNLIATKVTTLNGIVRDDGLPKRPGKVAATWTKVSGPGSVTFARAASPITAASFGVPGSYVLRLAASDGVLRASDEVAVTVTAATNLAPSVSAGPDLTVLVTAATALHPSVQDDGLPQPTGKVKTTWSKVKGTGSVTFANPSAADTTVRFSATGVYVLRLTADDGLLKTTDDVTINVKRRLSPVAAMLAVRGAPGSDAVDTLLAGRQLADLMFDI